MNMETFGITEGLIVVVIGFAMVFAILCIISLILSMFSLFSKFSENIKKRKTDSSQPKEDAYVVKKETVSDTKETDDLELVAVISAAIAASMSTTSDKIVIRSIRKNTGWNETAVYENQKLI